MNNDEVEELLYRHKHIFNCRYPVEMCMFVNEWWMHCTVHLQTHCQHCEDRGVLEGITLCIGCIDES